MTSPPDDGTRRDGSGGAEAGPRGGGGWRTLGYWYLTGLIVTFGLELGSSYLKPSGRLGFVCSPSAGPSTNWDGQWYLSVATEGYSYRPPAPSGVAFFPAYPALAAALARVTGLEPASALTLLSGALLLLTALVLDRHTRPRFDARVCNMILLSLLLMPTGFFFRVAYSESLFLFELVLVLYGIGRGWPPLAVALVVGLATATRPVGVGLIPAVWLYARDRSRGGWGFLGRAAYLTPAACWGIAAYMAFLAAEFGDPLAFSKAQSHWAARPPVPAREKFLALATFEPVRSLFDASSPGYWGRYEFARCPVLSLHSADPFLFLAAVAAVAVGAMTGWLNRYEVTASVFLLLIPYWTTAYETFSRSLGRYSSVAIPVYLVLGNVLARVPPPLAACYFGLCGFLLGLYSCMFAAWYRYL